VPDDGGGDDGGDDDDNDEEAEAVAYLNDALLSNPCWVSDLMWCLPVGA
jgi:hypothetical protein